MTAPPNLRDAATCVSCKHIRYTGNTIWPSGIMYDKCVKHQCEVETDVKVCDDYERPEWEEDTDAS